MPTDGALDDLARKARQAFVELIAAEVPALVDELLENARRQVTLPSERALSQQRQDALQSLAMHGAEWARLVVEHLQDAAAAMDRRGATGQSPLATMQSAAPLRLIDDDQIQRDILTSRLGQAIGDAVVWEFNDLRARICLLEHVDELHHADVLRPQAVARCCVRAFFEARLGMEAWTTLEPALKLEMGHIAAAAYHDVNRRLIERGVMPEVSLRTLIRRTPESRKGVGSRPADNLHMGLPTGGMPMSSFFGVPTVPGQGAAAGGAAAAVGPAPGRLGVATPESVDATLRRFNETMERYVTGFIGSGRTEQPLSRTLSGALSSAQQRLVQRIETRTVSGQEPSPSDVMQGLRAEKRAIKASVATPQERATVEIVALLFQSILTEEALPASLRVWFARLQMPTLRVALSEPDFFSSAQHPARRLIDRMGACVMGFDAAPVGVGPLLEAEIKRIVQVVEAFPETGRKVFQTVLGEFERFLERYFADQNESTRKGVSLAQQVELRETLAIQYTIELRKMLDGVPVQDGVRDFLFRVWADAMATVAVRHGQQSAEARGLRETALELVWIGSPKTSREERAQVIGRVPALLASLRRGMQAGGVESQRQEDALKSLNGALAAAFAARAEAIGAEQLARLRARLETLDELLPDADFELDDSFALDLSSQESDELEVVANGGDLDPSPEALRAVESLQVGGWYRLDYRDRAETVQLAWQGLRRQLWLFASPGGRCVLVQKKRLAAFLQAGLLVPAQDEALTVAATRDALAKINADPSRLLELDARGG